MQIGINATHLCLAMAAQKSPLKSCIDLPLGAPMTDWGFRFSVRFLE
jgi:hypothetical protein